MGLFDGCFLACDIDGTLMTNNVIAPRCVEKIRKFVSEGGIFALSTGRSLGAVSMVLEQLPGLIGPSVVSNGAMMYDYSCNKILQESAVCDDDRELIINIYNDMPQIGIELHIGDKVMILRRNREIDDHEYHERLESCEITPQEAMKHSWTKALAVADDEESRELLYKYVERLEPKGSNFIRTAAFLDGTMRHYVELIPNGVNKNSTLQKLCKILNIKKGCYFAIGDYYNDFDMLKGADVSACPIGSPEDIKREVDFVVGSPEDGAVADFIDHLSEIMSKH